MYTLVILDGSLGFIYSKLTVSCSSIYRLETIIFKLEVLDHKTRERAGVITPTLGSPVHVLLQFDAAIEVYIPLLLFCFISSVLGTYIHTEALLSSYHRPCNHCQLIMESFRLSSTTGKTRFEPYLASFGYYEFS